MANIMTLRRERGDKIDKMDALLTQKNEAGEAVKMSEDDIKTFNELEAEVKSLDEDIARAEKVEKLMADRATAVAPAADVHTAPAEPKAPKAKGTDFARIAQALIVSKGSPLLAAQWASNQAWDNKDGIAKALGSSTASGGGYLVPVEYSNDIIELLRNKSVIMSAGPRTVPLSGTMEIPKLTSGVTGGYVGENATRNAEQQTFGNLKLSEKKLMAKVPVSNDLIRLSDPRADAVVRDDIVAGLATTADAALLRDLGDGAAPKGLRYWAASGNVTAMTGSVTATTVETDIRAMRLGLLNNNVGMVNPVWIMAPRIREYLADLRDANGNKIYPTIDSNNTLKMHQIFTTNQVPITLGGGTESEIYLVDMNEVIVGEAGGIELMASDVASYSNSSGSAESAFDNDQTVLRAILRHDMVVRHDVAISIKTGVTWGA